MNNRIYEKDLYLKILNDYIRKQKIKVRKEKLNKIL